MGGSAKTAKPKSRLWREVTGWCLIVLGIAGCLLPIAPGIPFLIAGLALLAENYAWAHRALGKLKHWWEQLKARGKR